MELGDDGIERITNKLLLRYVFARFRWFGSMKRNGCHHEMENRRRGFFLCTTGDDGG